MWLNRTRSYYRKAGAVAYGVGIAIGSIIPSIEYFESISDGGEEEATLLKAQFEVMRQSRNQRD